MKTRLIIIAALLTGLMMSCEQMQAGDSVKTKITQTKSSKTKKRRTFGKDLLK